MKEWHESKLDLHTFLNVGDAVDDKLYWYFLEVLPPACWDSTCVQIGEPYSHDNMNRPMFATLEKQNGHWIYTGIKITPYGHRCNYVS